MADDDVALLAQALSSSCSIITALTQPLPPPTAPSGPAGGSRWKPRSSSIISALRSCRRHISQSTAVSLEAGRAGNIHIHTYRQTRIHSRTGRHTVSCTRGQLCSRWTLRRNTCSDTVDMQAPVVCAYRFTQWLCVCVPVCLSVLLLKRFAVSLFNEQLSLSFRSSSDMHGAYFWTWRKAKTLQRPEQFALTTLSRLGGLVAWYRCSVSLH